MDTRRLPCPQEVKKTSASQQDISNHFSDTKATGIRCRSEEEGLQQAEKWARMSHVLLQSTQRQAGSGLRQETGFLSRKEPRKVMLSLAPLAFSRKGPSPSLWLADAPFRPGRPRRTHSLRDPCTEGTRPGSRKAGFHFRLKSLDFPDQHKAQVSASEGRDPHTFVHITEEAEPKL